MEAKTPPEAMEMEVDCPSSGQVSITHNFDCPVRWSVVHWKSSTTVTAPTQYQRAYCSWAERGLVPTGWTNAAASQTTGCRLRMKTVTTIYGIRFFWKNNAANAYNVRVVLWNDTTGAVIAEKTVAVQNAGLYDAIFDTPVTTDLTGTDITASLWENGGTRTQGSNEALWHPHFPTELSTDHRLVLANLFNAGNVRPTTTTAGTTYYMDLLFAERDTTNPNAMHSLSYSASSTTKVLTLDSYSAGRAVIRIEPSQYGLS